MALNLVSLLSTTSALIKRNNTTTSGYNISSSLKKQVQAVYIGAEGMHNGCQIPYERFPVVFVELGQKSEHIHRMGNYANRDVELYLHFVGMISYGMGSAEEAGGRENAHVECIRLMGNIEYMLRNKVTLSATVQICEVESTTYNVDRESIYNIVGDITAKVTITDTD